MPEKRHPNALLGTEAMPEPETPDWNGEDEKEDEKSRLRRHWRDGSDFLFYI
jgi:hypothetical protein